MFSPNLGRWMTMDPIGYEAGEEQLYLALGNNPITRLDPFGLQDMEVKIITGVDTIQKQLEDGTVGYDLSFEYLYPKADLNIRRHFIQSIRNFSVIVLKDGSVINNPKNGEAADYNYRIDQSKTLEPSNADHYSRADTRSVSMKMKSTEVLFYMQQTESIAGLSKVGYKLLTKAVGEKNAISNISVSKDEYENASKWIDTNQPTRKLKSLYIYYAGCNEVDEKLVMSKLSGVGVKLNDWLNAWKLGPLGTEPFEYLDFDGVLEKPLRGKFKK